MKAVFRVEVLNAEVDGADLNARAKVRVADILMLVFVEKM